MPTAVLSVAPMPEPVSRYQPPEAASTSMPAASQIWSSLVCVPESSPREANGASAAAIWAKAAGARRIRLGADNDEVVIHQVEPLDAGAIRDELFLPRLGVHEQHVGVAVSRVLDRLAGAHRNDIHGDPGLLLEDRQEVAVKPR